MANEQNLIPMTERTPEERREIARKGAEATNKLRREKKTLKMELEALLEIMDEKGDSVQKKMSFALIKKAIKGDVRAFETIRDTIGQKPKENLNIDFDKNREQAQELLANIKGMIKDANEDK